MTEIRLRPWHNPEPLPTINLDNQNVDETTIPRRYFIPREQPTFTFTFTPAGYYDGMDTEGFDDLYPCTEDDLKDVQELL